MTTVLVVSTGESSFAVASLLALAYTAALILIVRGASAAYVRLATALGDIGLISTAAFFVPGLWHLALVVCALFVASSGPRTRDSVVLASASAVVFGVAVYNLGSAHTVISLLEMGIMFMAISARTRTARNLEVHAAEQFEELVNAANAIFWRIDSRSGCLLSITGDTAGLLGYQPAELVGRTMGELVLKEDRRRLFKVIRSESGAASVTDETGLRNRQGNLIPFRHIMRSHSMEGHHIVQGVSFEIAELEQTSEALRQYRDLFFHLSSAVLVARRAPTTTRVDTLVISDVNPACEWVLGLDPDSVTGSHLRRCLPALAEAQHDSLMRGEVVRVEGVVPALDEIRILDVRVLNLSEDVAAVFAEDITQAVIAEQTVRYQAEHDALTGLANRSVLQSALADLFVSRRHRASDEAALLMLDLNRFKEVNDTLGHPAGDELLRIVGRRLLEQVREQDLVARLGGDEFAVLLTGDAVSVRAIRVAERITSALEVPAMVDGMALRAHASIGIALAPNHGVDPETLLRRADIAMYQAKRANRPFHLFELSGAEPTIERLELSSQIGAAISAGQFELWFQPKLALATGEIMGAEGLLRWRHPERGVLVPATFLELVALTGDFHRLTSQVLAMGVEQAATCAAAGHRIEIAVNVSALSLLDDRICGYIARLLDDHGVSPDQIILEITESDALGDAAASRVVLNQLGQMGIGLSIDDFGTGHSSLARLRSLPVTEVKIDRSFVSSLHDDNEDFIIVRSIVGLAHDLGHRTVAEGVDSPSAARLLTELGCDLAQGFLYSPPLHPDELMRRLDAPAGFVDLRDLLPPPTRLPFRRDAAHAVDGQPDVQIAAR